MHQLDIIRREFVLQFYRRCCCCCCCCRVCKIFECDGINGKKEEMRVHRWDSKVSKSIFIHPYSVLNMLILKSNIQNDNFLYQRDLFDVHANSVWIRGAHRWHHFWPNKKMYKKCVVSNEVHWGFECPISIAKTQLSCQILHEYIKTLILRSLICKSNKEHTQRAGVAQNCKSEKILTEIQSEAHQIDVVLCAIFKNECIKHTLHTTL